MTLLSFIAVIFIVVRKLVFRRSGYRLGIKGVHHHVHRRRAAFCMGIMGQYIAKTYMEVKQRPHYIVAESNRAEVTRIK